MSGKRTSILNLGAGVQSTAVYLLMSQGVIPAAEVAVFADVQEEPQAVYMHLEWLRSQAGPPIVTVTSGKLGDDLIDGTNSTGQRFASIPAFTAGGGMVRRQCSSEYKIKPIERYIRRDVLGLKPRQRVPRDVDITQVFGISFDERSRASRIFERYNFNEKQWKCSFPLVDMRWSRGDCERFLREHVPHETPRSACVFCPFHTDAEWLRLRDGDAAGWQRAVEIDNALRGNARANEGMDHQMYLHAARKPLEEITFSGEGQTEISFDNECEGVCGV
jgi:3'-phosphoadenosine 5'-phosphosulfate sulfotransferase (PAPS reductase)/FAD synthetase